MKITFFTNTFLPHVGGVARSCQTFLEDFRAEGHRVLVVAPEFAEGRAPRAIERSTERVPAVQNFNGSDFSVRLPLGAALSTRLARFRTDVIHAHHPFLLGDTALRVAAERGVPVIFTHHTLYEQYTHYVPFDSPRLKEFVIDLSTRFANCCDGVIAPSESLAELIRQRGVTVPIKVVPTGIDTKQMASGDRRRGRRRWKLPEDAVVIGHVGRLAPEKNLSYLGEALTRVLAREPRAWLLVVGDGPSREEMEQRFAAAGVADRVRFAGKQSGRTLHDAYAAMDGFAFASHSETQGMVLAEAMAAGNAVVALDAPGAREIVRDARNGRLLAADAPREAMARALLQLARNAKRREAWRAEARRTAAEFDRKVSARKALEFYGEIIASRRAAEPPREATGWDHFLDRIGIETRLWADKIGAAVRALTLTPARADEPPALAG